MNEKIMEQVYDVLNKYDKSFTTGRERANLKCLAKLQGLTSRTSAPPPELE